MARPLAFGIRLRDKDRTVRLRNDARNPERYVVEETRSGRANRSREHATLGGAIRDVAKSWRARLH